jgi:CRISPR system Cascade subunit CasE
MYLTQIPLVNGDDYQQHQKVKELFPGNQRVLFQRTDSEIVILSEKKSDLPAKEVDTSSKVGDQHMFTLRLNPAKRDMKTKKRVALEPEQVKTWIKKQLEAIGVEARSQYIREDIHRSIRQEKTVSLASVLCFGVLTVKDASLFEKSLINGIGHGKGFGFGMLNIWG